MIVDCLTNKHQRFAESYSFKPWQTGLFLELANFADSKGILASQLFNPPFTKSVSLGTWSGHTYFAQVCSLKEFPIRSKIYATNPQNLSEYSSLTIRPNMCHEPIDLLSSNRFQGYVGGPVQVIIVDMDGDNPARLREPLDQLAGTMPANAALVLLDSQVF